MPTSSASAMQPAGPPFTTTGITLPSGQVMPLVGLGTWQAPPGLVGAAVRTALEAGYRHIDCAACYQNETEVGEALAGALRDGVVKREELFITSKLWNSEHHPDNVKPALQQTLKELQLDYLDLYLIHWPQAFQHTPGTNRSFPKNEDGTMKYNDETTSAQTWAAMEKLVDEKLTRNIGISNFNAAQVKDIHEVARIKPAVLQCESHPFFTNDRLFAAARGLGIVCTAYSPLGTGAELDGHTIAAHPVLQGVGKKSGKSAAQVAIAWQRQRGVVVIPKSTTEERIRQNLDVYFDLSEEDAAAVAALNKDLRCSWGGPKVERKGQMRPRDEGHALYPFKEGVAF